MINWNWSEGNCDFVLASAVHKHKSCQRNFLWRVQMHSTQPSYGSFFWGRHFNEKFTVFSFSFAEWGRNFSNYCFSAFTAMCAWERAAWWQIRKSTIAKCMRTWRQRWNSTRILISCYNFSRYSTRPICPRSLDLFLSSSRTHITTQLMYNTHIQE